MEKLILLIDDDQDEWYILKQAIALANLHCHCVWAEGADKVIAVLSQWKPDFIFIDYNMPRVDGITTLQMVRDIPSMEAVPIVIYSNHITEDTRRKAKALNASCIQKPDTIKELAQCLNGMISVII